MCSYACISLSVGALYALDGATHFSTCAVCADTQIFVSEQGGREGGPVLDG